MTFLVTGVGRSGSKFVAHALTTAGIPTGHERVYAPQDIKRRRKPREYVGEVSWLAIPHLPVDVPTIHATRHPLDVMTSLVHRPLRLDRPWGAFFLQHFNPPTLEAKALAVWRFATFTRIAETHASLTVRVEDGPQAVQAIAEHAGFAWSDAQTQAVTRVSTTTNKHHHQPRLDWGDFPDGPELAFAQAWAERYYPAL